MTQKYDEYYKWNCEVFEMKKEMFAGASQVHRNILDETKALGAADSEDVKAILNAAKDAASRILRQRDSAFDKMRFKDQKKCGSPEGSDAEYEDDLREHLGTGYAEYRKERKRELREQEKRYEREM